MPVGAGTCVNPRYCTGVWAICIQGQTAFHKHKWSVVNPRKAIHYMLYFQKRPCAWGLWGYLLNEYKIKSSIMEQFSIYILQIFWTQLNPRHVELVFLQIRFQIFVRSEAMNERIFWRMHTKTNCQKKRIRPTSLTNLFDSDNFVFHTFV